MTQHYLPVRLSHLLRHCSVGSIVRGPEFLVVVKDVRNWTSRDGEPAGIPIRYVDQIRSALGIEEELRQPPIANELASGRVDGVCVPALRFPSWMQCPSCGLLHNKPWRGMETDAKPRCQAENPKCSHPVLEQVAWVLVHADGHLADVPWHFLAHENAKHPEQTQCRADWEEPYLRLTGQGETAKFIQCTRCSAKREYSASKRVNFGNGWRQPWVAEAPDPNPEELAEILGISDARVHSPITSNALVIPPESRIRRGTVIDRLYSSAPKKEQLGRARNRLARRSALQTISSEFRCSIADLEDALKEIQKGYPLYGRDITHGILLESEYQALTEEIPDVTDDEDFVTEHHTNAWKGLAPQLGIGTKPLRVVNAVERVIAVYRLKEIMVLKGFQRLGGELVPPDIVGQSSWLPALELYGEGLFFSFEEKILAQWESAEPVQERARDFAQRFVATGLRFENEVIVSPRFILLHTLAHVLIRQLETEAGYPAASLKERIYCTAGPLPMSGILVYVAVPDVVGSLGGLAELATPRRFLALLTGVFDHSEWCSLDPVCSEHEGQGPSLLNRAACHGCALVPEPSCSYGNVLLDRIFIKGDRATGIPAFLDCVD